MAPPFSDKKYGGLVKSFGEDIRHGHTDKSAPHGSLFKARAAAESKGAFTFRVDETCTTALLRWAKELSPGSWKLVSENSLTRSALHAEQLRAQVSVLNEQNGVLRLGLGAMQTALDVVTAVATAAVEFVAPGSGLVLRQAMHGAFVSATSAPVSAASSAASTASSSTAAAQQ